MRLVCRGTVIIDGDQAAGAKTPVIWKVLPKEYNDPVNHRG